MTLRGMHLAFIAVCAGAISPTYAQTVPAVWSFGSVFPASTPQAPVECDIEPGASSFASTADESVSLISVPTMVLSNGAGTIKFGGLARLKFYNSAAGTMTFYAPPEELDGGQPTAVKLDFKGYVQTYVASTNVLRIRMTLIFPANAAAGGNCVLPFEAYYVQP